MLSSHHPWLGIRLTILQAPSLDPTPVWVGRRHQCLMKRLNCLFVGFRPAEGVSDESKRTQTTHVTYFSFAFASHSKKTYIYIYIDLFSDAHLRPAATSRHGNGLCSVALYHFGEVCQECIGSNV